MSLATRCTSCGTVFRVVQDQLKVSEGWVRCGRCDAVFNALEGLFDLEREPPPEWNEPQRAAAAGPAEYEVVGDDAQEHEGLHDPALVDRIDEQIFGSRRSSAFGALTSLAAPERRGPDFADARFDSDVLSDTAEPSTAGPSVTADSVAEPEEVAKPMFVREAERARRWQSSRVRRLLAVGSVLLALLLAGQAAHHFRDLIAARWPRTQPALASACAWLGCRIEAPRRIDDIVVESTALARAGAPDTFRLSVVLRNRGAMVAAMPWIELALTDPAGQLVARRALGPQDFLVREPVLAAGAEASLQALLATAGRVTGYTVEIFYP